MADEVYLDKIKLGAIIVEKELVIIEIYNGLIRDLTQRPEIRTELKDYPNYHDCWRAVSELFDFLEYDYASKLPKEDSRLIAGIMKKYKEFGFLSFEELGICVRILRYTMSLSKFHDVIRRDEGRHGVNKVEWRYKLKDGGLE